MGWRAHDIFGNAVQAAGASGLWVVPDPTTAVNNNAWSNAYAAAIQQANDDALARRGGSSGGTWRRNPYTADLAALKWNVAQTSAAPWEDAAPEVVESERTVPIIGYRAWRTLRVGKLALLGATSMSDWWPVFEPAQAKDFDHRNPRTKGGWHALLTLKQVHDEFPNLTYVIGSVALWGHVIRYRRGYRAEFAYPQRIIVRYNPDPNTWMHDLQPSREQAEKLARSIANTYGCEAQAAIVQVDSLESDW